MRTVAGRGALVVMVVVAVAAPAWAEHGTLVTGPPAVERPESQTLDIDVKLRPNGFRFGSRVFGRDGYAGGAWLNGEARADGFSVDGRIERGGKAHNFKLNADIDEWLRRAVRWWGVTDL